MTDTLEPTTVDTPAEPFTIPAGVTLTVRDIEDVEAVLGIDFADVTDAIEHSTAGGKLRIVAALLWVYRRKIEPGFTFDNARDLPPDVLTSAAAQITGGVTAVPL